MSDPWLFVSRLGRAAAFLMLGTALAGAIGERAAAGVLTVFRTPLGDIEVELYDQDKPVTVDNFVQYVQSGRFEDTFVQRWEPSFVIQGGGFRVINRHSTNVAFAAVSVFGQITNEYRVGRTFSNLYGTIAMARVGGQTNSATSQWFFNLSTNAFLDNVDGGFTVFGKVVRGTNVLERFRSTTIANGIFRANAGGALSTLPVLSQNPTFDDLVYTDISLLTASIGLAAGGAREIRWHSVSNALNRVEFSSQLPPRWETLGATNGTGGIMSMRDNAEASIRIYRVAVDF